MKLHVASMAVVENSDGEILLLQEGKEGIRGTWDLPGGSLDGGESITGCAERELEEEAGLEGHVEGLIAVIRETNNDGQDVLVFAFELSCDQTGIDVDGEEILDYRWVEPQEALDMELRLDNRRNVIQSFQSDQVVDHSVLHDNLMPR
jgi:8-oxo-dGTP diphosphatase